MNILLVDDDTTLAEVTAFALRRAGFTVTLATDGAHALELWEREPPDLLILDIQLPGIDGLSLCRIIRQRSAVPIIMLTVRDSDEDVVHGLELGADDYLTKPFSPKQLIARARAVLRRSHSVPTPTRLSVGDLMLDTAEQVVQTTQGPVHLTSLEFRLLHYLLLHPGQVVPTEAILLHVWGYADSSDRALLKQLVYRLRQKLASAEGGQPEIETVAGVGYRLGASAQGDAIRADRQSVTDG
ncbi:MAG: response regulator transcription factor [Chloroflexales bacterium]|nr:response regulator transcription factor [Chloroflexales bacterium]